MSIIDHLQCGRVIIFNSMLFKLRWAFCIDYTSYDQIVYRGLLGLKTIDKKTFLGFARIIDVFDYSDKELSEQEKSKLRTVHRTAGLLKTCKTVQEYVEKLYNSAGIRLVINAEGWKNVAFNKDKR